MPQDLHVRWHAVPGDVLAWRDWDGEVVVFNGATGNTHLLGDLGGDVFRSLLAADGGTTVATLAASLAGDRGADFARWATAVAEVLSDFARRGLAQPDMS